MQKIHSVRSVTLAVLNSNPPQLLISAIGQVVSSGWEGPRLVPYSLAQTPPDGFLNFDFVAEPPQGIAHPALYPIVVQRVVTTDIQKVKGVRVHSATNSSEALLSPTLKPVRARQGSLDPFLDDAPPLSPGLPDSAFASAAPVAPPSSADPDILLGGLLRPESTISGEGTGMLLYDVLVEVDVSRVPEAQDYDDVQCVVHGKFELMRYPRRGLVWTFVANDVRTRG